MVRYVHRRYGVSSTKHVTTLMEPGAQFSKEQGCSMATQAMLMWGVPYVEAIGCVLWLVMITRPDCTFAVGILSQFIQNLGIAHWEALKRVIVYLGWTKDLWLTFGGWKSKDFVTPITQISVTVTQSQDIVTILVLEQLARTWKSSNWLHFRPQKLNILFKHMQPKKLCGYVPLLENSTVLHSNNQGAIALSKNNKFHAWTKHIDVRYHFICEAVENGKLSVVYIPTEENPADILTKVLAKVKLGRFVELLGLRHVIDW